jgi:cyclic pyranopterin phosphate synthase
MDSEGNARMVDVGSKDQTRRRAVAEVWIELGDEVLGEILRGALPKGDALAVARIAGIQAAKRTSDLIPLCHVLLLEQVAVDFHPHTETGRIRIECEVRCTGRTGVEMEALTGASVAALTLYDMCKAMNKAISIDGLRLLAKSGGRSGDWQAPGSATSDPDTGGGAGGGVRA